MPCTGTAKLAAGGGFRSLRAEGVPALHAGDRYYSYMCKALCSFAPKRRIFDLRFESEACKSVPQF